MKENFEELKAGEMEKAVGGTADPNATVGSMVNPNNQGHRYTSEPHCRSCKKVVKMIGAYYICDNAHCGQRGIKKTIQEIDWY